MFLKEIQNNLNELGYKNTVLDINNVQNHNFSVYSGIIITGGPTKLSQIDYKKFIKPFEFIKNIDIPILGICLGHQIIGLLYSAKIGHGELISRDEEIQIVQDDSLFINVDKNALFKKEHSEFISLPSGFTLLAKSISCNNEAMKLDKMYGVQFHPEMSGENGKIIFENFLMMF
jgi:GMP synthase (glutamine-hydrolysing)